MRGAESGVVAARRWLLFLLSLGSLAVLAYGGVLVSFSVPVTPEAEAAARPPGETEPRAGLRALVAPLAAPAQAPTFVQGGEGWDGRPGVLLVVADTVGNFPASAGNATVVRALAHVAPDTSGAYAPAFVNLTGVPVAEGGNASLANLSVEVAPLAEGRRGFLVKGDAEAEVRFVPEDRVVGRVARFETLTDVLLVVVAGAVGFVTPLVVLIATHRPSGRAGIGDVLCAECRRPLAPSTDFCPGCGAWKTGRGG